MSAGTRCEITFDESRRGDLSKLFMQMGVPLGFGKSGVAHARLETADQVLKVQSSGFGVKRDRTPHFGK